MALLRVSGADWNVEAVLTRHQLRAAWWRKRAAQPPTDLAGFNLVIAQAHAAPDLGVAVAQWFQNNVVAVSQLVPASGLGTLILLMPDEESPEPRSRCALDAATLGVLAAARVGLEFKVYSRSREQAA
jgi:hypothetical protein